MNFAATSCEPCEMEKTRLLTAERFKSSKTLLISSVSEAASLGVTTLSFGERSGRLP